MARQRLPGTVRLATPERFRDDSADWCFCNGVFHHIPRAEQPPNLERLRQILHPGGRLTIFENNPLNPGAHLVMRRIPFDADARMISPFRLARAVRRAGFGQVERAYLFLFPRALASLRGLEPLLLRLPIGAQYLVSTLATEPPRAEGS